MTDPLRAALEALVERLRTETQPIYLWGSPGERDHVAVWKYGTSRWNVSWGTPNGAAVRELRSRLTAAQYALTLAAERLASSKDRTGGTDEQSHVG